MTVSRDREAAENALLDQRIFRVDAACYAAFVAHLDAPVEPTAALRRLLSTRSPWER